MCAGIKLLNLSEKGHVIQMWMEYPRSCMCYYYDINVLMNKYSMSRKTVTQKQILITLRSGECS